MKTLHLTATLIHLILHFQGHLLSYRLVSVQEANQRIGQYAHFQGAASWQPSFRTIFQEYALSEKQKRSVLKGF